jgi:hypothetical protein
MSELFKPSSAGRRGITENAKDNGKFINPPRFPELGGFNNISPVQQNNLRIKKPGGSAK